MAHKRKTVTDLDAKATVRIKGIVFWKDGEPRCKIKRSDFGFKWN